MEQIRSRELAIFSGCLTVKSAGRSGGLCLLWSEMIEVEVLSYSQNHIDTKVIWEGRVTCFSGIYGHPESHRKILTWQLLRHLHGGNDEPWLVGGDINEIMKSEEKLEALQRKAYF